MSRRFMAVVLAAATILSGLVWRLAPLHLPGFAYKYGGSVLYGAMLYWLLAAGFPRARTVVLAVAATGLAFGIECFKLVRGPGLDAFRLTLAGRLVLGRVFTVGALVAYAVGIGCVAVLDGWWCRHRRVSHP